MSAASRRYGLLFVLLTGAGSAAAVIGLGLGAVAGYIAGVNLALFLLYGIDKLAAIRAWTRSPERVLHTGALLGGSPAALLGQYLFSHKHAKGRFMVRYWTIVALQAAAIVLWLEHAPR